MLKKMEYLERDYDVLRINFQKSESLREEQKNLIDRLKMELKEKIQLPTKKKVKRKLK